ncbi:Transcription elongation factor SPT4 [Eumeta japonica]|uniref:Transcription elongation factor SPT4 n=1 Tax=Eumeta variegata TaxID=151549 RepID=A0A4C1W858_EUMVA|nr:Transcription elongation factor SPT4 [Eumeta japonica]
MSLDTVPKDLRGLRACLVCSLVKTFDQFEYDGCDNCEEFLRMKNNKDNVYDCTSSNFDGMIAVMSPEDSWVCKWQRIKFALLEDMVAMVMFQKADNNTHKYILIVRRMSEVQMNLDVIPKWVTSGTGRPAALLYLCN